MAKRGSGYNMPFFNVDGNDVDEVIKAFGEAVDRARSGGGPTYFSANTYRFRGHSMSDAMKYRTKDEMEKAKARDPIALYEVRLREKGLLTDKHIETLEEEVNNLVSEAIQQADQDAHPPLPDRFNDVLSETYPFQPK